MAITNTTEAERKDIKETLDRHHCKRRCWRCKYLKNISNALAKEIRTG